MQIFFKSRTEQRAFKGGAKKVDNGSQAATGQRWGVQLSTQPRTPKS